VRLLVLVPIVALLSAEALVRAECCREGDLTWTPEQSDHCYQEMTSFVSAPMGYPDSVPRKRAARAKFVECIARYDAEVAREKAEHEERERKTRQVIHEREVTQKYAQEAARAQGEQEERERQAEAREREQRLRDPSWMKTVLSGVVCYDAYVRARALELIRIEQKYANAGGGIVDKVKLYDLQTNMRRADEEKTDTIAAAKRVGVALVSCSAAPVRDLVECLKDSAAASCSKRNIKDMSEFFDVTDLPD